jgi:16S rRNA (cytosine967-C5)-methyltransferase
MKQVPAFAAVDLSCKLALLFGGRRQVNFANAVLRTIERTIEDKDAKLTVENEINILPKTSSVGVQFKRRILPSRDEPVSFLSRGYSYPEWLVKRWLERFGFDRTKELLAAGNGRPAIMCRPNVLKFRELCGINTLVDAGGKLADRLAAEGCRAIKLGEFGTVEISDGPAITTLPSFQEGLFQLQNVTSQRIVHAVGVREGQKILDLCAGLGTKTTQIAELTFDRAKVCATDRSEAKLEKLRTNADRLGITGIEILPLAAISSGQYDGAFDVALADVPCSNTGVLDSRPEVRWRLKQTDLAIFARGALELLALASRLTAPAGRIGYSTCSIDRDENEKVVQEFMARVAGWRLIDEHTEYPSADPESGKTRRQGGYWATLERAG